VNIFGELFKGFRTRAGLHQEELADRLGLHRNTITAWENSRYLPRHSEMVEALAKELYLSEAETNQLLAAAYFPPKYKVTQQAASSTSTQPAANLPLAPKSHLASTAPISPSEQTLQSPDLNRQVTHILERVDRLRPGMYISCYRGDVYVSRQDTVTGGNADDIARDILRKRGHRAFGSQSNESLGFCVIGRPTQGKTRLAWEAMQAVLPSWIFIKWPHNPNYAFDFAALRGRKVVLWLNDLQHYANLNEARALNDLPYQFEAAHIQLKIIATCRDADDEVAVFSELGELLRHLVILRPADITSEQADQIERALRERNWEVHRDQFDGTPGSLLLGVQSMAKERYPRLSDNGKRLLRALKLLHTAKIYMYSPARVQATATDLFDFPESIGAWREALEELVRTGFLRFGSRLADGSRPIEPVAEAYLERAIPDYPIEGAAESDDWPMLQTSFYRNNDTEGLISLGMTLVDRQLRSNAAVFYGADPGRNLAARCFDSALATYVQRSSRQIAPDIEGRLGQLMISEATFTQHPEQIAALEQETVKVCRAVLEVVTKQKVPFLWAWTQHTLGRALAASVEFVEDWEQITALEAESIQACQAALEVFTKQNAPLQWAWVQSNLAFALAQWAVISTGGSTFAGSCRSALEACNAALEVLTKQNAPFPWALAQATLGFVLNLQGGFAQGAEQKECFKEAIEHETAALEVLSKENAPILWAWAKTNIARALALLAQVPLNQVQENQLEEAIKWCQEALDIYSREHAPIPWGWTYDILGRALLKKALMMEGAAQTAVLDQSARVSIQGLSVITQQNAPFMWAEMKVIAGFALTLGAIAQSDNTMRDKMLDEAITLFRSALEVFTPDSILLGWCWTQRGLGLALILKSMAMAGGERNSVLEEASEAFTITLTLLTRQIAPKLWAEMQGGLGIALTMLASSLEDGERVNMMKDAVMACQSALEILTLENARLLWTWIQSSMTSAQSVIETSTALA
jgi:transcriptional regulator with XRE-family HTH domain/tetratricopeptide (TPR) repeat protein